MIHTYRAFSFSAVKFHTSFFPHNHPERKNFFVCFFCFIGKKIETLRDYETWPKSPQEVGSSSGSL